MSSSRTSYSIRGKSDINSNIFQFNLDKAKSNPGLELLTRENKYFANDILDEQEELIILNSRRNLINEI